MDLICFVHPSWTAAHPAGAGQAPVDDRHAESFAYRCLPLNIANAHGWELLNPCAFDAAERQPPPTRPDQPTRKDPANARC